MLFALLVKEILGKYPCPVEDLLELKGLLSGSSLAFRHP